MNPHRTKRAPPGSTKAAGTGQEAKDAAQQTRTRFLSVLRHRVQQERTRAERHPLIDVSGKLRLLSFELAEVSADLGQGQYLDAARVVEGVRICLGDSEKHKRLARAATDLAGKASELPRTLRENRAAADALVKAVRLAQCHPPDETAGESPGTKRKKLAAHIAEYLDIARTLHAHRGARRLLPSTGTRNERIALFTMAIDDLLVDDDRPDAHAVVGACARKLGNKRELFGAQRKRERREDQR